MTDSALDAPDRAQLLRYLGGAGLCALANNVVLIVAAARGVSNLPAVIMAWLTGGTIGYLWHHSGSCARCRRKIVDRGRRRCVFGLSVAHIDPDDCDCA